MIKIIVKTLVLLIVLIGMVGIAAADPCPNPSTWTDQERVAEDSLIKVFHAPVSGNEYEFLVWGSSAIGATGAKFHELCVADESGTDVWDTITTIPTWDGAIVNPSGEYFIQWKSSQGNAMLSMDGSTHKVGTATFQDTNWLDTVKTLVHVDGQEYCEEKYPNEPRPLESCYIMPKPPTQPVPELGTLALMSTGLIGLVLVSRKYRT